MRWWRRRAKDRRDIAEPMEATEPTWLLADLGVPRDVNDVWVDGLGVDWRERPTAPYLSNVLHASIKRLLDEGVSMAQVAALGTATVHGRSRDGLISVAEDAYVLARVERGEPDPETTFLASTGRAAFSCPAAVDGSLVDAFVEFLDAGWEASDARRLLGLGLDFEAASRLVPAQAWTSRGGAQIDWEPVLRAVRCDPVLARAWSRCPSALSLSEQTVREWTSLAGNRGPLLVNAGVSLAEFRADPTAFADDAMLAAMAGLRAEQVAA